MALGGPGSAAAQIKPEGEMRFALYVTLAPAWLDPGEALGASKPNGNVVLKRFEYALPIEADPYDPVQAKKLLAEAGYPNGFDAGELYPAPPPLEDVRLKRP